MSTGGHDVGPAGDGHAAERTMKVINGFGLEKWHVVGV